MRLPHTVLFVLAGSAFAFSVAVGATDAQEKPKTTWDGVYSAAQAARGGEAYGKSCASCHAADLTGQDTAPSLAGAEFNNGWNDLTLGDLYERIHTTMPADGPGSLSPQQYVDIIAFLLSKGNFPAGGADLPAEPTALKQIKYVAQKP
jgi:S-disulfanyl-L-cysteine oxidoreductase SoxD